MDWKAALFKENEVIGFKRDQYAKLDSEEKDSQFFVINPLKTIEGGNFITNIKEYRNILIEFDSGVAPEEQWKYIQDIGLPYTTCIYSGNKSLHFIIALKEGLNLDEYYYQTKLLVNVIEGADKLLNPNRLARVAGTLRPDTKNMQELIEVKEPIEVAQLVSWQVFGHLNKKVQKFKNQMADEQMELIKRKAQLEARKVNGEERLPIPRIYRDMQTDGVPHPNAAGRHESLVKFGVWLIENEYTMDEVEEELHLAAVGLGIDGRQDDKNVLRWLYSKQGRRI
jgi:hypothetical protein